MLTEEELVSMIRALTKEGRRKFLEELEKALHSPQNRTELSPDAGQLPHSHYTTENKKMQGR